MNNASINVGIVGATGAVGQELLRLLHDRNFPMASLRLFASARSAGKVVECAGKKYRVEEAKPGVFADLDVAFFAAGGSATRALAPILNEKQAFVWERRRRGAVPLLETGSG